MIGALNVLIWVALVVGALAVIWLITEPNDEPPFGYRRWEDVPLDDLLDDPIDEAVKRHPSAFRKH